MRRLLITLSICFSAHLLADEGMKVHLFCQPNDEFKGLPSVLVTTTTVEGMTFQGLVLLPRDVEPLTLMADKENFIVKDKQIAVKEAAGEMETTASLTWTEDKLSFEVKSEDSQYKTFGVRTLEHYKCTTESPYQD